MKHADSFDVPYIPMEDLIEREMKVHKSIITSNIFDLLVCVMLLIPVTIVLLNDASIPIMIMMFFLGLVDIGFIHNRYATIKQSSDIITKLEIDLL